MRKKTIASRLSRFLRLIYLKLFRINDTPHKIAIGFGLGVFMGVLPGTGIFAALFLAFIFRVNRAGAILGSVLTNTWLSLPVFFISLKAGAAITGIGYRELKSQCEILLKDFHWADLFNIAIYKMAYPIIIGYFLIALVFAALCYAAALVILKAVKRVKR